MGSIFSSTYDKPKEVKSVYFPEFETKLPSLEGKTIAITGCTSGTGLIAAKTCAKKGASNVLLLNRPSERAQKAEETVKASVQDGSATKVETVSCDLQDFGSVKEAIETIKSKYDSIDVLCNNAGVMALDDYATKDGYDVQMQTNHLSHFLLTKELFPLLKRAQELRGEARIVNHSSLARTGGGDLLEAKYFGKNGGDLGGNKSYMFSGPKWTRYSQSKLANSVFTAALAEKLKESKDESCSGGNIKAVVAAPGLSATNLQVTTHESGGMAGGVWLMLFAQSAEDGTMPLLSAMIDPTSDNGDFWEPRYYGNFSGPAIKIPYDKYTENKESADILWKMSEEACGKFDI